MFVCIAVQLNLYLYDDVFTATEGQMYVCILCAYAGLYLHTSKLNARAICMHSRPYIHVCMIKLGHPGVKIKCTSAMYAIKALYACIDAYMYRCIHGQIRSSRRRNKTNQRTHAPSMRTI